MKLNFGKKLLLFLHWLLSLMICVLFVLQCVVPNFVMNIGEFVNGAVGSGMAQILSIAMLAVYGVISAFTLIVVFSKGKKRNERGLITVDASDTGRTRIAIGAVEQMVRQAVRGVDGIGDMKCGVVNNEDAISINISVTLLSGAHVPTVTMNMQRAIRGYIELNCGVAVSEICISVNAVETPNDGRRGSKKNLTAAAPVVPMMEVPAEEAPAVVESAAVEAEPTVEEALEGTALEAEPEEIAESVAEWTEASAEIETAEE